MLRTMHVLRSENVNAPKRKTRRIFFVLKAWELESPSDDMHFTNCTTRKPLFHDPYESWTCIYTLSLSNDIHFTNCTIRKNRLLHRKCAARIFFHELQIFRNERVSVANEWVSKVLQRVNKIRTKHFLWCNLFVRYIRPISCNKPSK